MLGDLDDLHANFLKQNPNLNICLSAFKALRPKECIPVGAKGTHNVCVCKIHGNIRLKMIGLQDEFSLKKQELQNGYRDYLKNMICLNPTAACYLKKCQNCPGAHAALRDLQETLQRLKIKNVSFNQWLTTDRYNPLNRF